MSTPLINIFGNSPHNVYLRFFLFFSLGFKFSNRALCPLNVNCFRPSSLRIHAMHGCYKPCESLWPCEYPHMATVTGQVSHPWPCEFYRSDLGDHLKNNRYIGQSNIWVYRYAIPTGDEHGNTTYLATNTIC